MATPIAPTPVLVGEDAEEFLKADEEEDQKFPLLPTPRLKKIREKMLADDRDRAK